MLPLTSVSFSVCHFGLEEQLSSFPVFLKFCLTCLHLLPSRACRSSLSEFFVIFFLNQRKYAVGSFKKSFKEDTPSVVPSPKKRTFGLYLTSQPFAAVHSQGFNLAFSSSTSVISVAKTLSFILSQKKKIKKCNYFLVNV